MSEIKAFIWAYVLGLISGATIAIATIVWLSIFGIIEIRSLIS
jgi:hypothetical protein